MEKKLRVGMYGKNGHQIGKKVSECPDAVLVAVCDVPGYEQEACVKVYATLDEMLADGQIDLISLCSPKRGDQAKDAIKCLRAGKHVYAEKPAAFTEKELDEILAVAEETGYEFHEMADSIFIEPYWSLKKVVQSGKIGEVVQVYLQKSYDLSLDWRPQDEYVDGGIIRQAGIHAVRFLEHVTGLKIEKINGFQTHLGNSNPTDGLFVAASLSMTLSNGGVAAACFNYLRPRRFIRGSNECVRFFGTDGMAEVTDGGAHTHVYTNEADEGEIDIAASDCREFFDLLTEHLLYGNEMPMTLEEELHPLRVVIRAREAAQTVQ